MSYVLQLDIVCASNALKLLELVIGLPSLSESLYWSLVITEVGLYQQINCIKLI